MPSDKVQGEAPYECNVFDLDLVLDGKALPARDFVKNADLERCMVRMAVTSYDRYKAKAVPLAVTLVSIRLLRHEVRREWRKLIAQAEENNT